MSHFVFFCWLFMLDHPITVVLNVFGTGKLLGYKSVRLWVFKIKKSTSVM